MRAGWLRLAWSPSRPTAVSATTSSSAATLTGLPEAIEATLPTPLCAGFAPPPTADVADSALLDADSEPGRARPVTVVTRPNVQDG